MTTNANPSIGILAGMGPSSTAPFLNLVLKECSLQYGAKDDIDFPKIVIQSQPTPFFEDRPLDHASFETAVRTGLLDLQRSGASVLGIACNTAHIFYSTLTESIATPLLNMVELAVKELGGSPKSVAIMAARATAESGIYQKAITDAGHQVVEIEWQNEIDHLLGSIRESHSPGELQFELSRILVRAEDSRIDAVIIACLDLSGIPRPSLVKIHWVDASRCLARQLVAEYCRLRDCPPIPTDAEFSETTRRGAYTISTDSAKLDVTAIHSYLTRSYWASGITLNFVERSIRNSLCFGLYDETGSQIGFARLITDRVTFAYLGDVYVLESHRGQGLGKWLVEVVKSHPDVRTVRRFMLVTRDAQSLYSQFGFHPLEFPERVMEITRPNMYREAQS